MSDFHVVIIGSIYADNISEAAKLVAEDTKLLDKIWVYEVTTTEKDPDTPQKQVCFV